MTRSTIIRFVYFALTVSVAACAWSQISLKKLQIADSKPANNTLFLLSANIEQPVDPSDPVMIYKISAEKQLNPVVTVLESESGKEFHNSLTGVYSVHEIGDYLIVDYPHQYPRNTIFIPKENPVKFESVKYNTEDFLMAYIDRGFMEGSGGMVCDLWPLSATPQTAPLAFDERGHWIVPKATLRSVCKKPGTPPFLKIDNWDDYKSLRLDGDMRYREVSLLSEREGKLIDLFLGGPIISLGNMPAGFDSTSDNRGVRLKAANNLYLVISIVDAKTGQDHNTDVFVRTASDGKWTRLSVPAAATTNNDDLRYRLFDDWLVTSLSASLASTVTNMDASVADLLTVTMDGTKADLPKIIVQPAPESGASSPQTRTLTLYNLADSRRIDLAIPEDDSEIVHVFDGHSVLLRIKDSLFSAEIQGSKLMDYKLVAHDSAIPQVHWAFYSSAK